MSVSKNKSKNKTAQNRALLKTAKRVLKIESDAVAALANRLGADFPNVVNALSDRKGRLIITGMGKSGLIGQKIAATMSSVGLPAVFMHAAEAIHGDLGLIAHNDVVIAISNSGETEEIIKLLPTLNRLKCTIVAMVGNLKSTLAIRSDFVLDIGVKQEAGGNGLVPTASTTATLAMGDALVIAYLELRGFKEENFALNHPGGSLGRKMLTTIDDLMHRGDQIPMVNENSGISIIISEITKKRLGVTLITDKKNQLKGIITDGDLRRMIEHKKDISKVRARELSKSLPKCIKKDDLATKAVQLMEEYSITSLVVSENGKKIEGIIHLHDLLKAGIV
ncbi:MAG: KpsF/GutQ family sugar-phosphate isomerase [Nitrospinaceae bacterium]|jgi:arabinose-5-phosphate isomerase|nr:KpsF/GutQ family sugar-phosphate isomerase [Nitrospinaceae bacterium]MDP7058419.1 KpsF/GutQ family sugar-phosphate isomerase [Nitrospinaceae bacterium]HAK37775.1 D-arabinose 5-phosphate isomerase [Nitrospina sp.]|tara:strand:- start:5123 stop:6130 length:1008 start_codon:yes stop_codon:yes gene_type:complete